MASIQQDPSGNYHVSFRFGGKRFKRSLKTKIHRKAEAAASHIEENIRLIEAGRMTLPTDADIPTFLMSDGRLRQKVKTQESIRLDDLLNRFMADSPEGAFELTTLKTTAIHLRHVCRILGASRTFGSVNTTDLQAYVSTRSSEPGKRGAKVSAATIRKEIATLGSIWNWAESRDLVSGIFPRRGLLFPKHDEKPPFQTWEQIERRIQKDGLTEEQAEPLWDCLYLKQHQLNQLLSYVEKKSEYDFLYPMCCLAAFTGARRSELSRARTSDIDMVQRTYLPATLRCASGMDRPQASEPLPVS